MPRFRFSLGTQLIALLLIALIGTQAVALWLFAGERRTAIFEVIGDALITRTVSLVPLLEDADGDVRAQILKATSSPVTRFWVSEKPSVAKAGNSRAALRLTDTLKTQLGTERDIRVTVSTESRLGRFVDGMRFHHRQLAVDADDRPPPPPNAPPAPEQPRPERKPPKRMRVAIDISTALGDGTWLNATTLHRPPPPGAIRTLILQIGLMGLAIVLIVAFMIRQLAQPLRRLAASAERLGRGEDVPALAEAGPSEVRSAIRAFNDMQARLTRFVNDRTRMLAAISHDLRTPITSLRLRAEFIEDEENRDKIIETLEEMSQMTEATLAFARDEASREEAKPTDLGGLLESLAGDQQDLGHRASVATSERLVVTCRTVSLKRAFRNLIENGIRYGEAVDIDVKREGKEAVVTISDQGPGIPEEKLSDVFEPFVRLEESRSEETGGIGLGLAITRSIIHAHGGTIELKNGAAGGLKAIVRLPVGG